MELYYNIKKWNIELDTLSVKFCAKVGMNYASCSPFRVPIARLAAAQAAVEE
ncbi:hypothetical protein ONT16_02100 [Prevotella copri]|uniref:Uncharacterized protein n=1 Tax=Segatella copri TaxID=165179 RepID=A0AAP3B9K2_9BACT|nr:hypothetical protein [Segatella copri]MCW4127076.1 hypothetical protein [Segatella copri]